MRHELTGLWPKKKWDIKNPENAEIGYKKTGNPGKMLTQCGTNWQVCGRPKRRRRRG
jgi:hypothetical protein